MKLKSPLLIKFAAWLTVKAMKAVYLTIRRDEEVADPLTNAYLPDLPERYLYCTWHDSLIMPSFHAKPINTSALVSAHQDGSFAVECMKGVGIAACRGSSGKRGVEGLRNALQMAKQRHITITPDGPRGPHHVMKDGIVFLASKSGNAIVPMAFRVSSCWRIKGRWTDMIIPKPFCRITMLLGEPIRIPKKLGREGLVEYTELVQQRMDALYERTDPAYVSKPDAQTEPARNDGHETAAGSAAASRSADDNRQAA